MSRSPEADLVAQLVADGAEADAKVQVVGSQVITTTPADAGKTLTVDENGLLVLVDDPGVAAMGGLFRIEEQTLLADGPTFDFTAIPADYKDLVVELSLRSAAAATFDTVYLAVNGDTTDANYRAQGLQSSNTSNTAAQNIGAANVRGQFFATGATSSAGDYGAARMVLPDYTNAGKTKIIQVENEAMLTRASGGMLLRRAYLAWLSTAVINRLTFAGSANFLAGSSVSLYGRKTATPL